MGLKDHYERVKMLDVRRENINGDVPMIATTLARSYADLDDV